MKFPTLLLLLFSGACAGYGASVQGGLFDAETQNPLARTHVTLAPLPGTAAGPVTLLSNDNGQFLFSNVRPGWYLLRASRIGYAMAEYGQYHPGLPGVPFEVTDSAAGSEAVELRQIVMQRQAAITGSVFDDNLIGIPGWAISVYTARKPVRRIAQGLTDDRGNFRVGELEPGTYLVRSGAGGLEDGSTIVPSYYKYGTAIEGAETVHVRLGETQGFVVIHTVAGRLFELTGEVVAPDRRQVSVTLVTDTGRRMIGNSAGPFTATGVPPGMAELLVEGAGCAGYQTVMVDRNMFARADCLPFVPPLISGALNYPVIARRLDLDGPGAESVLTAGKSIGPGHWEFTVRPGASQYLVGIQNEGDSAPPLPVDGWFGLDIGNAPHLRVTLSAKAASISGVASSLGKTVTGAPVFLELVNPDAPELATQSWLVRADPQGNFVFGGLAPGVYRLMSSFYFDYEDPIARDKAVTVTLREGDAITQPLEMILQ